MTTWLITFLLFFLPLVVYPIGALPFEFPKVIAAELGIIFLVVMTFLEEEIEVWKTVSPRHLYLSGLVVILSFIHLIFLRTPTTLMGDLFRLQGVYLLWLLMLFSLLSSRFRTRSIPLWVRWVAVVAVFGSIFLFGADQSGRAVGSLGDANALAAAGIFLWPWLFFSNSSHWGGVKKTVSLALMGLIVFLSGSRAGLAALTVQLTTVGLFHFLKWPLVRVVVVSVSLLVVSVLWSSFTDRGAGEHQIDVWRTAIYAGFARPLFGHGFGNTEQALSTSSEKLSYSVRDAHLDSSQNVFLDWWVQGGTIGVSILLLFIAYALYNFAVDNQLHHLTLLLGLVTVMSLSHVSIVTLVAFWWVVGHGFIRHPDNFLRKEIN